MNRRKKMVTILHYFGNKSTRQKDDLAAETMVKHILDDILTKTIESSKKHRHTGGNKLQPSTEKTWLNQYPWLRFKQSNGAKLLFCETCCSHEKKNAMATKGSHNFQLSTIKTHEQSSEHRDAIRLDRQLKRANSEVSSCNIDDIDINNNLEFTASESDKLIFRTIYFCAKSELSSETVNKLLEYDRINGLKPEMQNLSWTTINEMQQIISKCLQPEIVNKMKDSEVFGLMIDESCDLGNEKKLVLCVRYVKNGEAVTSYLSSLRVNDGKSHKIVGHVQEELQSLGLNLTKMVGLGTDGAAAMTGKRMGVGVQVKAKMAPFVTQVHCFAHRLALGTVDSIRGIKQLETFKSMFNTLYIHFSSSAVRTAKLREIQLVFEDPELKIKEPHAVRWLSLRKAVETVVRCYPSVVATLSDLAETNSTAKALHKYFRSKTTAILTSVMWDIHDEIASFSCCLQTENLIYSEIKPKLEATLANIQTLRDGGKHRLETCQALEDGGLKGLDLQGDLEVAKASVTTLVNKYIDSLEENLTDRLTQQDGDNLCNLASIFSPQLFDETLADGAIEELGQLFGTNKHTRIHTGEEFIQTDVRPLINKDELMLEWPRFKAMVKGTYRNSSMRNLCRHVIILHSDILPNMALLCKVALCICVTSVSCERAFSFQNRLKTKFRCSWKEENIIDNLIRAATMQGFDDSIRFFTCRFSIFRFDSGSLETHSKIL